MLIVVPLMLLVNCGFFPIVNFNPDNPVDLGLVMRVMIFVLAASAHWNFGRLAARVFPGRSPLFIGLFNAAVVCGGLLGRYLLEFGEVSNTYNFTPGNTVFHVVFHGGGHRRLEAGNDLPPLRQLPGAIGTVGSFARPSVF